MPGSSAGILRGAKSDLDGALADYAKTIELNPKNARAYANRGLILLLRRQDAAAQKEFDNALRIDGSLKTDLQKSIDQIIKAREVPPAGRRPQKAMPAAGAFGQALQESQDDNAAMNCFCEHGSSGKSFY
jgi:tetratricopeptide (TPR) repeat protein